MANLALVIRARSIIDNKTIIVHVMLSELLGIAYYDRIIISIFMIHRLMVLTSLEYRNNK